MPCKHSGTLSFVLRIFFIEKSAKLSTNLMQAGQNEATVEKIWMLSLKLYFPPSLSSCFGFSTERTRQ